MRCGIWLRVPPKVLCLTMIPGGGALTPALQQLGYTPYTFWHTFSEGRVSTHPQEWCMVLDKKKPFNHTILDPVQGGACDSTSRENCGGFDALVGPPCTLAFEVILKECPFSTRVILVEEPDKEAWARDAAVLWDPLLRQTERAARRRAGGQLHEMIVKMTKGMTGLTHMSSSASLDLFEERVKAVVPKDRLLVYRYGDGWEPLCEFLSKQLPSSSDGEYLPFPPREGGEDVVAHLTDRLQRVERVVLWATWFLVAAIVVLYTPLFTQLRDIVAAYYEDYRDAFEPVLQENEGKSITLRQALVLAKNSTMLFEAKWRAQGGVVGAASEALNKLANDAVQHGSTGSME